MRLPLYQPRPHNISAMYTHPKTVIIQSTFSGFQDYATSLPDVVVIGKNVPEVKIKLHVALKDHLLTGG